MKIQTQCPSIQFVGLLALCAVAVGCNQGGAEPQQRPIPTMTVAQPVRKQIVEWDAYMGRLEAVDFVEVRARVSGYLETIHFDEGQVVNEGDLLFVIDPRPYQAELNRALAALRQAESGLQQSRAQLTVTKALKLQADARLQLALARVQRTRQLKSQNAITQADLDQDESAYLEAEADVEGSKAGITSAEAAIATEMATVESVKAEVETAELNLEYTRIRAPVSGRISHENVTEGNLVSGGTATSTLLTTIASVDPIYCTFDANEQEVLKYVRLDQAGTRASSREAKNPVYLGLVDETAFPHLGHMDFVDNRFDTNSATMRARCVFPNDDFVLVPGMFARIRIPGSASYEAVLIPDSAIGTDQASQFVYVVIDGVIERRGVKLGPIVDGLRVVREGLSGGESLVIEGLLQARPEMAVKTKAGEIKVIEDGLPDQYEPLPPEQWISPSPDPLPASEVSRLNRQADQGGNSQ